MSQDKTEALGKRIAKLRKSKGFTIERLAYEMDLSKGNLSDLERGKKNPRYTTLHFIAEGLGISISELLKGL